MSLADFSLELNVGWRLLVANGPFAATIQGPDGRSYNLDGLDLTTYDAAAFDEITLVGGEVATYDLRAFLNADAQGSLVDCAALSLDSAAAMAFAVEPADEDATDCGLVVSKGDTNGWPGVHGVLTGGIRMGYRGFCAHAGQPEAEGTVGPSTAVTATSKTIKFRNPGTHAATVFFLVVGARTP